MFRWFSDQRRKRLNEAPFPDSWEEILRRNVSHYCMLNDEERGHLRSLIQIFIDEKDWDGAGGLELNDEIRVTISAQACLLLLGLEHNFYRNVESIIVYPTTVIAPERQPGFFENVTSPVVSDQPILGQAFQQGPVIIVWDAALHNSRHPQQGCNVVYHEFAHKLDMLDGTADGTPPLRDRHEYQEWVEICSREYLRLKEAAQQGRASVLNPYGATNEAEFFAVATEMFFDQPQLMVEHSPDLYRVLQEYYRQDPVARISLNYCMQGD